MGRARKSFVSVLAEVAESHSTLIYHKVTAKKENGKTKATKALPQLLEMRAVWDDRYVSANYLDPYANNRASQTAYPCAHGNRPVGRRYLDSRSVGTRRYCSADCVCLPARDNMYWVAQQKSGRLAASLPLPPRMQRCRMRPMMPCLAEPLVKVKKG